MLRTASARSYTQPMSGYIGSARAPAPATESRHVDEAKAALLLPSLAMPALAPNESTAFWLGVTLAVVGNALIAMCSPPPLPGRPALVCSLPTLTPCRHRSLTLQKLAHNKAAERGVPPHTLSLFWIGLVGMAHIILFESKPCHERLRSLPES